jgi:hypothetical protein
MAHDQDALRLLIRTKLAAGRLPRTRFMRIWGGPAQGELCNACEQIIPRGAFALEDLAEGTPPIHLHLQCFHLWDEERQREDVEGVTEG